MKPTPKQWRAWRTLNNLTTNELLYGGAAGGGKTFLGCAFCVVMAEAFPGMRAMIGRRELKRLKQSVLVSLFDVLRKWGYKSGVHYKYISGNETKMIFSNGPDPDKPWEGGSEFTFMDLAPMPSDPNYERLGSLEFTIAWIEEASEVEQKAKDIVGVRIRYKLSEFCGFCHSPKLDEGEVTKTRIQEGVVQPCEWLCKSCGKNSEGLPPKLLLTCNPHKGYLYMEYYKPWKAGQLSPDKAFIRSLVTDNPHVSPRYLESLRKLKDKVLRARLLLGDWEYADDENALFIYDAMTDMFSNTLPGEDESDYKPEKYITADVARFGRDKAVIMLWEGLRVKKIVTYDKSSLPTLETEILVLAQAERVPLSHVLVDEDGVGGGVVDHLKCKGFVGNSTPIEAKTDREMREVEYKVNYQNLRTQCYYELAEKTNDRLIAIDTDSPTIENEIIEELEQIKAIDVDKDAKFRIISKDEIKKALGRSPDYADTLMMRMYFEVKPERRKARVIGTNAFD